MKPHLFPSAGRLLGRYQGIAFAALTPSPGTPGEGWGGGILASGRKGECPGVGGRLIHSNDSFIEDKDLPLIEMSPFSGAT